MFAIILQWLDHGPYYCGSAAASLSVESSGCACTKHS